MFNRKLELLFMLVTILTSVNMCSGKTSYNSWFKFLKDAETMYRSCPFKVEYRWKNYYI